MSKRSPASCLPSQKGLTLVELMVAMAVLVILLAVAAPGFRDFTRAQRIKTASFELASAMSYARSEAIKRRSNVVVAALSSDFANGWEVRDAGGVVLRAQAALPGVEFAVTPAGTTTFTYGLDGRIGTDTTALIRSTSSSTSTEKRCLSVDTTGMPRSRKTTATTC